MVGLRECPPFATKSVVWFLWKIFVAKMEDLKVLRAITKPKKLASELFLLFH